MKHRTRTSKLHVSSETIRTLNANQLIAVVGGWEVASGSQGGYSGPCPPPKNGEGSGCVTG